MNNAKIRKEEIRTVGKDATGNRLLSSQIYVFAKAERLTRVILKTLPLSLFYTVYVSSILHKAQCKCLVQDDNGNNEKEEGRKQIL